MPDLEGKDIKKIKRQVSRGELRSHVAEIGVAAETGKNPAIWSALENVRNALQRLPEFKDREQLGGLESNYNYSKHCLQDWLYDITRNSKTPDSHNVVNEFLEKWGPFKEDVDKLVYPD